MFKITAVRLRLSFNDCFNSILSKTECRAAMLATTLGLRKTTVTNSLFAVRMTTTVGVSIADTMTIVITKGRVSGITLFPWASHLEGIVSVTMH